MKDVIQKTIEFVVEKSKDHYRRGRRDQIVPMPSILHPMSVVKTLYDWGINDLDIILAAWTHDILEDTNTTIEELISIIGEKPSSIVLELTFDKNKETKEKYMSSFEDKSIAALVVKVSDRINNITDFKNYGHEQYACEYFRKASNLFSVLSLRVSEIEKSFGKSFLDNILDDSKKLELNIKKMEMTKWLQLKKI